MEMEKQYNPYYFLNTFCYRTPFFSLKFYKKLIQKSQFNFSDFVQLWKKKIIKESIFLASPDLFFELEKLSKNHDNSSFIKLKPSFLKYIFRASTRCTPFGLFSGIGCGSLSDSSEIVLLPNNQFKRNTLLDTQFLFNLCAIISQEESIQNTLYFYPNTSGYPIGNQYRYIEYALHNDKRNYSVEAIETNLYLETILEKSKEGKTIKELEQYLIEQHISKENAQHYIKALIANQILVNELELNISGNDILSELIALIQKHSTASSILKKLYSLQNSIKNLDYNLENDIEKYQNIMEAIDQLNIPYHQKYLFQADLYIENVVSTLHKKHAYSLKKLLPFLLKLNPFKESETLLTFKKAFVNRYETEEIPLSLALDIESGLGYLHPEISETTPFLQDITPTKNQSAKNKEEFTLSNEEKVIYQKLIHAQKTGNNIIELVDHDFENSKFQKDHLPDTLTAFVNIVTLNDEEHIVLQGFSSNAGKLLGRFASGHPKIKQHLQKICSLEKQLAKDKILAEIVHLPEARTGNILKRPHLRDYEIPYLAKSTLNTDQQIPITDLYVSVKNDTIVLTSKKLGKEIIPKLTNAHNYSAKALPIYHFLCDLELQNQQSYLGFRWPKIAAQFSFLPRVIYKNTILSKATWFVSDNTKKDFFNCNNDVDLLKCIQKWKETNGVHDYVVFVEGDNTLPICLTHLDSIKLFLKSIKNKNKIELQEFLELDDGIIQRKNEHFSNECLLTFYNQQKLKANGYEA